MLTLKQLVRITDQSRKTRAQWVRILALKTGYDKQGRAFVACQSYSRYKVGPDGRFMPNSNPTKYVTLIVFLDKTLHCKVACSCLDNTFRWEVANSYKGAADVEYSNGDPPDITNSAHKAGLCKHMLALYERIKNRLP